LCVQQRLRSASSKPTPAPSRFDKKTKGIYVKPGRDRDQLAAMLQREGYVPVWLEPHLLDLYYNGFCNSVLWQVRRGGAVKRGGGGFGRGKQRELALAGAAAVSQGTAATSA
jgi:hypothetical protein